jgi:predicted TPR repeat methyltransferase
MNSYRSDTYGEHVAEIYDRIHPGVLNTDDAVDTLSALACGGSVLELGVGTGRLAIPLAARGLTVHGIDSSEAMLNKLRSKPGGDAVTLFLQDFSNLQQSGKYRLVVVAADTLFMLPTQDDQVRCFNNVARHLTPDGLFVVEAFVPDQTAYASGGSLVVRRVSTSDVVLGAATHDRAGQLITGQQILIDNDGFHLAPGLLRYAWPSELDLMALLAGMRLRSRWGGWQQGTFSSASSRHVSVYERLR